MSNSETNGHELLNFDEWVVREFHRTGGFTALIVLVEIGPLTVVPLRSSFVHIIGDEIGWDAMVGLLAGAGVKWDGVLLEAIASEGGGPVADDEARAALGALGKRVIEDRLVINDGHFFDHRGRRLKIEEAEPQ